MKHIVNQINHPELRSDSTLHVIRVVSNPVRYHSRYRLARIQEQALKGTPNMELYTVEAAFGDRHHELTQSDNDHHLQVRTNTEVWIKENLINLGVRHLLPKDWKYMAWIDADILWRDKYWALETLQQLQHFAVVQPWQTCIDLGHMGHGMQLFDGFGYVHQTGQPKKHWEGYKYAHTGFAWACTRNFWENIGKLLDFCILGSADHHMAWGMIGDIQSTINGQMPESFFKRCEDWQRTAMQITKGQVGFTPGNIEHMFHGPKKRRYYRERWQILVDNHYDPDKDLMYDSAGVLRLVGKPRLEYAIRKYNRSRFEDSIEEF
jgi:hypothetical protein